MQEIYWLTRLDYLRGFLMAVGVICIIVGIIYLVININIDIDDVEPTEQDKKFIAHVKKLYKLFSLLGLFFLFIRIFIPSEKEAYLIYGIGGTIDYLRSNDQAKQLPNKVINCIDKWIETATPKEESKDKTEDKNE